MEPLEYKHKQLHGEWYVVAVSRYGETVVCNCGEMGQGHAVAIAALLGMGAHLSPDALRSGRFTVTERQD